MGCLLVSVRGPVEAVAAARGGAHIADVEHPGSALGTPYPLNIKAVREALDAAGFSDLPLSTNIGEDQPVRSSACQAALGVAIAGANYVKCGLAKQEVDADAPEFIPLCRFAELASRYKNGLDDSRCDVGDADSPRLSLRQEELNRLRTLFRHASFSGPFSA